MTSFFDIFLWGIFPYIAIAILIGGLIWRYKFDQFGWTTRSSQIYESKLLKVASPLFHYSLFAVTIGHLVGLVIPKGFMDSIGITQDLYHMGAFYGGGLAGIALVVGIGMLIYRRRVISHVFKATTRNDKAMYLVLALVIVLGMLGTAIGDRGPGGTEVNYRETVSPWFRSLFIFRPDIDSMAAATWSFQLHTIIGLVLFAMTPFTRIVHAFTAPLHYLFRPYIVYRSADVAKTPAKAARRGWAPVGTTDSEKDRRW